MAHLMMEEHTVLAHTLSARVQKLWGQYVAGDATIQKMFAHAERQRLVGDELSHKLALAMATAQTATLERLHRAHADAVEDQRAAQLRASAFLKICHEAMKEAQELRVRGL